MPTIIDNNTIDLKHSILKLRADGIIQINYADHLDIDLKEGVEVVEAIGILTKGKKALILNVAGEGTSATAEARKYSASVAGVKFTIADAFVTNSLAQKILGNFYLAFNKPPVPTQIFEDIDQAVEWLKAYALN
jgi:hypothetical protein